MVEGAFECGCQYTNKTQKCDCVMKVSAPGVECGACSHGIHKLKPKDQYW